MKIYLLVWAFLAVIININGQTIKPDQRGINYYEYGVELMNATKFRAADSIFSLALRSFKDENVYVNRAISRIMINDTIGFCHDMGIASTRYFDNQAEKYFNEFCCSKVDTIYYDKKKNVSHSRIFRYYEVIKKLKYVNTTIGTFHDIKSENTVMSVDFGNYSQLIGARGKQTDMIGAYIIDNYGKNYFVASQSTSIKDPYSYEQLMRRGEEYLNSKFGYLKKELGVNTLRVYFIVYASKYGTIMNNTILGFYPELNPEIDVGNLEATLSSILNSYPNVKPAKLLKDEVPFMSIDYIEF